MLADHFTQVFREEHRQIRDTLLDLMQGFNTRNMPQVQRLLQKTAELTGPHFRNEEEVLYPGLVEIFGGKYIGSLFTAHDGAIGVARKRNLPTRRKELEHAPS